MIHPLVGALVSNHICTYKDLKESLTLEDSLRLYEILLVNNYNDQIINKFYEEKQKRK